MSIRYTGADSLERGHQDFIRAKDEIANLKPYVEAILDRNPGASVLVAVDQLARMAASLVKGRNHMAMGDHALRGAMRDYLVESFDLEADAPL